MGVMDANVEELSNEVHIMNYTLVKMNSNMNCISYNLFAHLANQNFEPPAYPLIYDELEDDKDLEEIESEGEYED